MPVLFIPTEQIASVNAHISVSLMYAPRSERKLIKFITNPEMSAIVEQESATHQ